VLNSGTLSDLYGVPIDVIRIGERIVVAGIPDTPEQTHHETEAP
jgi:zinc/manganese transport system ATP-binding protein